MTRPSALEGLLFFCAAGALARDPGRITDRRSPTTMKIPSHPKLKGEWAEVHFLARASEHGLSVAKPYGDCRPYDFIVESNGRMLRVQVKSTTFRHPRGTGVYMCRIAPAHSSSYPSDVLDFIAACIIPEYVWYIIPFARVTGKQSINLDPRNERSRYDPYREAWHLLGHEKPPEVHHHGKNERLPTSVRRKRRPSPLTAAAKS